MSDIKLENLGALRARSRWSWHLLSLARASRRCRPLLDQDRLVLDASWAVLGFWPTR